MAKMSTDPRPDSGRQVLNGPTMGTRWSAVFDAPTSVDIQALETALTGAVTRVDEQMSTWKPASDLMRLNGAGIDTWVDIPIELATVLLAAMEIGRLSDGAFDIGLGDLIDAWGFGPAGPEPDITAIKQAFGHSRPATHDLLEIDISGSHKGGRARKHANLSLDLNGIAKGFGVDEMLRVTDSFDIGSALVSIDGEVRTRGDQADGKPWVIAVEKPDYDNRTPLSILTLKDAAIATSGDYRHWIDVGDTRLAHTMDRLRGGPTPGPVASVSVIAPTCMEADAWATALLVHGADQGPELAKIHNLDALFLIRDGDSVKQVPVGPVFSNG